MVWPRAGRQPLSISIIVEANKCEAVATNANRTSTTSWKRQIRTCTSQVQRSLRKGALSLEPSAAFAFSSACIRRIAWREWAEEMGTLWAHLWRKSSLFRGEPLRPRHKSRHGTTFIATFAVVFVWHHIEGVWNLLFNLIQGRHKTHKRSSEKTWTHSSSLPVRCSSFGAPLAAGNKWWRRAALPPARPTHSLICHLNDPMAKSAAACCIHWPGRRGNASSSLVNANGDRATTKPMTTKIGPATLPIITLARR